ncbi:RidA family protein [Thalassospira marina]|uniref:RidA family protein n=1 Tax=Thalassospira marina TaxID=2048283 RepID=A0A2N3KTR9_9PROT|nr:RidA family protein [Thalassospira marina]PKR53927.1 RidA family protein [Thalassospira marina]
MNTLARNDDIRCLNSQDITRPAGHYSHICVAAGQVFISGQLPILPDGTALTGKSFHQQATRTLANLDACLACAGVTRDRLLQVRIYVTDIKYWPQFNDLYASWIGDHRPARAVASVPELHFGLDIEIEAIALSAPENAPAAAP